MVYLVNGQLNLHKSDICGGDFIRYLHDLRQNYKLSEYGSVLGMDHYGVLSKTVREKQLDRIKQYVVKNTARKKKESISVHSQEFSSNKLAQLAKENVPNNIVPPCSSLWDMDLYESLLPFADAQIPSELSPTEDELITIEGEQINLATLSNEERKIQIDKWQQTAHLDKKDTTGPSGFIFALQECNVGKNGKMGDLAKNRSRPTL